LKNGTINLELKNKEWFDILGKVSDHQGNAVIIIDSSFDIIYTNQQANLLFFIDAHHISLEQVFEIETVQMLTDLAGPVLYSFKSTEKKDLSVKLKAGIAQDFDLFIEALEIDETKNILLLFKKIGSDDTTNLITRIKIQPLKSTYPNNYINVNNLISEITQLAPFTLVSIKQAENLINQYDVPIWIKDKKSILLCINNSYANVLGIEVSLAKSKKHEVFLPPHQQEIFRLLDHYILANRQQIILEGFSKKGKNSNAIQNTIQIPILDYFNNIVAVVGLIVDINYENSDFLGNNDLNQGFINSFPKPLAILDCGGIVELVNPQFGKLFNFDPDELISKKIDDFFPFLLTKILRSFLSSDEVQYKVALSEEMNPTDSSKFENELYLRKYYSIDKRECKIIVIIDNDRIQAEDGLQNILMNRGKMFDILIQKNPEPIFIYDKENLKFLEVNEAAIKLYGYHREEFLQMDLTDLYAPEDIQTLLDSFGDEASESRFSKPFRHRKKDGTNVLVEISKTSFMYNEKEAHFNIVKDITGSVERDKQNQMLKVIFNESDLMVFITDPSGFITSINHKVTEILGYTQNEIFQSSLATLVIDDDRGVVNTAIFQSHLKDSVSIKTKFKNSFGKLINADVSATPILDFDGEVDSYTVIVKSEPVLISTEQPKEIVREVIKEVIKEVVVEKPVVKEQKSIVPDSNFLSGMFHEILTPINVIIGFSQELISSNENPTPEQLEASEIINQNRIKMMDTMNSVVEYSDIVQNKSPLNIEDITITDIIEKLDENIKDISGINDIQFAYGKISSSIKFKSDKQKFENFILALIKIVSRLSKDKKIYFSAFSLDKDSFIVGISDQYGNPSEYVTTVLEQVFAFDKDPKDFGLPKLTTHLARILQYHLGGKFYRSSIESVKLDTGFIFPISFSAASKTKDIELPDTTNYFIEPIELSHIDQTVIESDNPNITQEYNQETSESDNVESKDAGDIFKPVPSAAKEIISKIVEESFSEDDFTHQEIDAPGPSTKEISEHQKIPVTINSETQSLENLSEEINKEIDSEKIQIQDVKPIQSLDLSRLNCLYIEDQVDSQILFKVQMKGLNDVKFAVSFEEAQLLLLNHQFDFIVMDINLQGEYNGLDALKIIKTMPAFSSIPIIAVTAYVLPGDKEKFITAGFNDFISKPIFKEKMMESLEKIFLS
jgi:PAS domain S-box-containing protein